jgi:hypothetical protein
MEEKTVTLADAKTHLSELTERAAAGEDHANPSTSMSCGI